MQEAQSTNRVQQALVGASQEFLAAPIENLGLKTRAYRRLVQVGVSHVGDLVHLQDSDLLKIDGFGLTSLLDICTAISERQNELASGRTLGAEAPTAGLSSLDLVAEGKAVATIPSPEVDLATTWNAFLGKLPSRTQDVLLARMGAEEKPATLDALGKAFGLTRERIRQLQQKAMARFQSETRVAKTLESVLTRLLSRRSSLFIWRPCRSRTSGFGMFEIQRLCWNS